ncbi:hypothetical protein MHYP_G00157710 [Metynnis hypsauchen]
MSLSSITVNLVSYVSYLPNQGIDGHPDTKLFSRKQPAVPLGSPAGNKEEGYEELTMPLVYGINGVSYQIMFQLHLYPAQLIQPDQSFSAPRWAFSSSGSQSRPADVSFYPAYCFGRESFGLWRAGAEALGSGRLAPGERQQQGAQWALALACSDTSRTGEGGLSGPAGVKPSLLTPSIPPYPKHAPPGMGNSRLSALPTLPA